MAEPSGHTLLTDAMQVINRRARVSHEVSHEEGVGMGDLSLCGEGAQMFKVCRRSRLATNFNSDGR